MKKIYVDSNVFISFIDKEYGRNIENFLEYFSEEVFKRTVSCEFFIVISELVIHEVMEKMNFSDEDIEELLMPYKKLNKLIILDVDNYIWRDFVHLCKKYKTHRSDAIHAILAKKSNSLLVTWNLKDFKNIKDIEVRSPKEL